MNRLKHTIYLFRDPRDDAARYVGVTRNLRQRLTNHYNGHGSGHCRNWVKSLRSLGLKPVVEILEIVESNEREDAEKAWIIGFRQAGADLVNLTDGGEGTWGWHPSPEARIKMSIATTRRMASLEARARVASWMTGRHVSLETRAKMSLSKIGQRLSPEHRSRIGVAGIGRTHSLKAKAKISASRMGIKFTEETRAKMRVAATGRIISPATRIKMSIAQRKKLSGRLQNQKGLIWL